MKFEGTEVWGFKNAMIGMRLPMSKDYEDAKNKSDTSDIIGPSDMKVAQNLEKADDNGPGEPNSKVLRMIHVQTAITAPLCFWKEWDTYKVATVSNSTSTMHKIGNYVITEECFESMPSGGISPLVNLRALEDTRKEFNKTKDKEVWYKLIYGLPDSWLQTRMVDLNYATLRSMIYWRKNHKQNCWSGKDNPEMENFIKWARTLPYAKELLFNED
jgi:hypothetical protein